MNIYDTANKLAQELRQSEEYVNYKMAKETLKLKPDLKKKIDEFEMARYEAQIAVMQTGKMTKKKQKRFNNYMSNYMMMLMRLDFLIQN